MAGSKSERGESLLIQPAQLIALLDTKTRATFVDVRNPKPWNRSDVKIRGAVRIDPVQLPIDPAWPKDDLLVFY